MKTAHTPGPWMAKGKSIKRDMTVIGLTEDAGETVACVLGGESSGPNFVDNTKECEANARLIEAAPDLLEALLDMVSAMETYGYNHSPEISIAREAISKATGAV